jgi:hypothetical protein
MKKIITILLSVSLFLSLLLIVGCKETVYEEAKDVSGNNVDFAFTLPQGSPTYDVSVSVRFRYTSSTGLDKFSGTLLAPSGKQYTQWAFLKAPRKDGKKATVGSTSEFLQFSDVAYEEGTFTLSAQKEPGSTKLTKATLKVQKEKEKKE